VAGAEWAGIDFLCVWDSVLFCVTPIVGGAHILLSCGRGAGAFVARACLVTSSRIVAYEQAKLQTVAGAV